MKILIIKPSSFGDIVQALPSAHALKSAYPGCHIAWIVFNQWRDICELCPDIDEIITWDRTKGISGFFAVVKKLYFRNFDLIIDLQGLMRSAILAKLVKGKTKIGVSGMKEFSSLLLKEVEPQNAKINATIRNLKTIFFFTKKFEEPQVNIKISDDIFLQANKILSDNNVRGGFTALLPFARGKGKDWSVKNYLNLIDLLAQKYPQKQIIILGIQKHFGRIKSDKAIDLCGKTDLKQLAAILSKSHAAIGADTGSMHLACMLNVLSIFIFGISDVKETSPRIGNFVLLINKESPQNINAITPQTVLNSLNSKTH